MTQGGLFITFEGIDGAGKSSHVQALAQAFWDKGRMVTVTREPGGTPLSEKLRELVLNDAMDAMTEALLVFAARREHLCRVIEPALAKGEVVLCDRFTDSSFAYQGYGRGFDLNMLTILEQWTQTTQGQTASFIRHPDLTLWFDLAPEIAAQRLADARQPDKFEAQSQVFFQRVREGYRARLQAQPQRVRRIDANQAREAVWDQVLKAVQGLL